MEKMKLRITGIAPLLMHNGQLSDPLNEHAKAMKEVSSKRKKTDEDHEEMSRLEFAGGLYVDEKGRPAIPASMIESFLHCGAKKSKLGKDFLAGAYCEDESFALEYTGPKKVEALWANKSFVDRRNVRVQKNRVMRTRPIFREWALDVVVVFDPNTINRRALRKAAEDAGGLGMGDYRPRFGRCLVEEVE